MTTEDAIKWHDENFDTSWKEKDKLVKVATIKGMSLAVAKVAPDESAAGIVATDNLMSRTELLLKSIKGESQ